MSQQIKIEFSSLDHCIDLKNELIKFIKSKKREIKDRGTDPDLTFNHTFPKIK